LILKGIEIISKGIYSLKRGLFFFEKKGKVIIVIRTLLCYTHVQLCDFDPSPPAEKISLA
jgi:hypothetical protein